MTILITGATGMIGQEIVKVCHAQGFKVHYLTTSKDKIQNQENFKGFYWNPEKSEIDHRCFETVSAIINLVGATISKRWTTDYKKTIIESRTQTAQLLQDNIRAFEYKVDYVISASAIGIYPSSMTNYYEEDNTQISPTFLGTVVNKWEDAVDNFETVGCKVAKIRIGLVLSEKGGALPQMVKPIAYGLGAPFGSGKQWQSWIHIKDLANIFVFALTSQLTGIYNAVAPNPVTNKELTKTAAKVLRRPLLLPNIPRFVMKIILGEMHILLFESQRVSSQKIKAEGYNFKFPNLKPALQELL